MSVANRFISPLFHSTCVADGLTDAFFLPLPAGCKDSFKTRTFHFLKSLMPKKLHFLALEHFLQTDRNSYAAISDLLLNDLKQGVVGLLCFDETSRPGGSECGDLIMQQLKSIAGQPGQVIPTFNIKKGSPVMLDLTDVSMVIIGNSPLEFLSDHDGKRTPTFRTGAPFSRKEEVERIRRRQSLLREPSELEWLTTLAAMPRPCGSSEADPPAAQAPVVDWARDRSDTCVVSYLPEVLERYRAQGKEEHLLGIVRLFLLQLQDGFDESYKPPPTHLPLVIRDSYGSQILPQVLAGTPTKCITLFQGRTDYVNGKMNLLRDRLRFMDAVALRIFAPGEPLFKRLTDGHVVPVFIGSKRIHCVVCPSSHRSLPNLSSPWTDVYDYIVRCYRDCLEEQNENALNWLTVLDAVEACMTKALARSEGFDAESMPDLVLLNNLLVYSSSQSLVYWPNTTISSRDIYHFWVSHVSDFCLKGASLWRKKTILSL